MSDYTKTMIQNSGVVDRGAPGSTVLSIQIAISDLVAIRMNSEWAKCKKMHPGRYKTREEFIRELLILGLDSFRYKRRND